MRSGYDEEGFGTEIKALVNEIQNDAEQLNIAANRSECSETLKQLIAALADKIDGLQSFVR